MEQVKQSGLRVEYNQLKYFTHCHSLNTTYLRPIYIRVIKDQQHSEVEVELRSKSEPDVQAGIYKWVCHDHTGTKK
jgi:hypothetical protein